ncbi:MAG: Mini-ribonuclease 3 [Clostridia bacterium]|nr:Mini-ribonuclease 3 [Clostridia bacterium]
MEETTFKQLLNTNLLPLAFIGDSVHTLYVREKCLENPHKKIENYHTQASFYCKASSQAKALERISEILTDEEKEIVRRGRNAKPKHSAKNATSGDYSHATAFEVLIGFLYLSKQTERLKEILELSMQQTTK